MYEDLPYPELVKRGKIKERLKLIEAARFYEDSLYEFLKAGWRHIDPAVFVGGWHLAAIAEHLEAVTRGHIKRLLINVPPRMSKSSMVSVAWPAWTWLQKPDSYLAGPEVQFLYASYAESLAVRDSIKTRRLIESPWYQRFWGDRFQLVEDQNTKIKFENTYKGYRFCTSVGGTVTGEGGAVLAIDDAHKADEVESELVRRSVIDWYDEVFSTRMNDPKQGAIVVIGQRVHEDDISGHLMEKGFTQLVIPMEYEEDRHCVTVLGIDEEGKTVKWEDPRTKEGEMLCEGRYGVEELAEQKKKPFVWAGQFQQRPAPKGGSIIKREYWRLWEEPRFPQFEYLMASLDTAYTEKQENDPSALTIWGLFRDKANNPKIMLVWSWRDWLEFPSLCQKIIDICTVDRRVGLSHPRFPVDRIIVEAKASGYSIVQELSSMLRHKIPVDAINPGGKGRFAMDKTARLYSVQHLFADGMIYAPDRQFAENVIRECEVFPKGSHDDLVDTVSMGLRYFRDAGFALMREEYSREFVDDLMLKSRQGALYPV